jgi:hypothetical protein
MPITTYSYTISVDFAGGFSADLLERKVNDAGLGQTLNELRRNGDDVDFTFADALSGGDKTTFDGGLTQAEEHPPLAGSILKDNEGPYVPIKEVVTAATDPGATDDIDAGCDVGTIWANTATNQTSVCTDSTAGAAVWDKSASYQLTSGKDAASGYAGLDGSSKLDGSQQTYGSATNTACEGDDARLSDARAPTSHASDHVTGGGDKIRDATAAQDGLMTAAFGTKVDGIEALADVTDATNVNAAGAVMHSDVSEAEGVLRKTGSETYEAIKSNLGATTDPGATDDSAAGYAVGSDWINVTLDKAFVCLDATASSAIWKDITAGAAGAPEIDAQESSAVDAPTETSATFVDLPGMSVTTSNTAAKQYAIAFNGTFEVSPSNKTITIRFVVDGVAQAGTERPFTVSAAGNSVNAGTVGITAALATGKIIKMQWKINSGTATGGIRCMTIYGVS